MPPGTYNEFESEAARNEAANSDSNLDFIEALLAQGNVLVVDAVNGNDGTGERGSSYPYLTPTGAKSAAVSGDMILVRPGAYTCSASLAKAGVNWHFMLGASVTFASASSTAGIWDDGGTAMTFSVSGRGVFTRSDSDQAAGDTLVGAVMISHASSVVSISALEIASRNSTVDAEVNAIFLGDGTLTVDCDRLVSQASDSAFATYPLWWDNGTGYIHARVITSTHRGIYLHVNNAPTGDLFCWANTIEVTGTGTQAYAVQNNGSNATAAAWITADTIKSPATSTSTIFNAASNKLYVHSMKIFGGIACSSGLLYVVSDKVTALANNSPMLLATGGTVR